jgi:hypothetical protein
VRDYYRDASTSTHRRDDISSESQSTSSTSELEGDGPLEGDNDPILEEEAFASLMEAHYGPQLQPPNNPDHGPDMERSPLLREVDSTEDDDRQLDPLEAEARMPLFEGSTTSRYICMYCLVL